MKKIFENGHNGLSLVIYYIFYYIAIFAGITGSVTTIATQIATNEDKEVVDVTEVAEYKRHGTAYSALFQISSYILMGSFVCFIISYLIRRFMLKSQF